MNTINRSLLLGLGLLALGITAAHAQRPSIAALQTQITTLQSQVASGAVPGLASYVSVDTSAPGQPAVTITAANLKVVNGLGATASVNGVGNVIVGYDEARMAPLAALCSLGEYTDQTTCTSNGGTWAVSFKSGSHNVVIGHAHAYSRYGGLAAGYQNVINGEEASVSGGRGNVASGYLSSVSGGENNKASGTQASISGGLNNVASGFDASISGGANHVASGGGASISGGINNTASGNYTSVSGGNLCNTGAVTAKWVVGLSSSGCSLTLQN